MEPYLTMSIGDTAIAPLPVLDEGFAPLDLPAKASLNQDGSVRLTLDYPVTLEFRTIGGGTGQTEQHGELVFARLTGKQVAKMLESKRSTDVAMALSTGVSQARMALLLDKMDASDATAARNVVAELLGGLGDGLPKHAEETPDGVVLQLRAPAEDGDGTVHTSLTFKRLTGGDLKAIGEAKDTLPTALHRATRMTLKQARGLFDNLDGADAMDANRVVSFLAGTGQTTGR